MSLKPSVIRDVFNVGGSFTWHKRIGVTHVLVVLIGGGSGGGGAGLANIAGAGSQGGGGGGGAYSWLELSPDILGNTETVVVGAGGIGNLGQLVPGGAATATTNGGNSRFGNWIYASGGVAGTTPVGAPGIGYAVNNATVPDWSGGSSNQIANTNSAVAASGGGTGQPITAGAPSGTSVAGGVVGDGGARIIGRVGYGAVTPLAGGLAAVGVGNPGGQGNTLGADSIVGGSGGGGGNANGAGAGGKGGKGGYPGGGGGGGGSAVTPNVAGAGGDGADGIVVVINYFG